MSVAAGKMKRGWQCRTSAGGFVEIKLVLVTVWAPVRRLCYHYVMVATPLRLFLKEVT